MYCLCDWRKPTTVVCLECCIAVSANRRALVWKIGAKFTGRNLEIALPATVYFTPAAPLPEVSPRWQQQKGTCGSIIHCCQPNGLILGSSTRPLSGTPSHIHPCHREEYIPGNVSRTSLPDCPLPLPHCLAVSPQNEDDPLCVGPTAYVDIRFRINDFTLSGLAVDPATVTVSSGAKVKLTTGLSTS